MAGELQRIKNYLDCYLVDSHFELKDGWINDDRLMVNYADVVRVQSFDKRPGEPQDLFLERVKKKHDPRLYWAERDEKWLWLQLRPGPLTMIRGPSKKL